jgi:hypothetical protein
LIEQSTKLMDAVHKRLHSAQARELQLLKERFREDPEAFWRFNKKPAFPWEKAQFIAALENSNVVPVADPNNPTSLHRIAKATAIKQLQTASPQLYDAMAVDKRIMHVVGVDPEGLFLPEPAPPPPDPRMEAIQTKAQTEQTRAQIMAMQAQIKAAQTAQSSQDRQADRESRERIEQMKIELEKLRLQEETMIHQDDAQKAQIQLQHNLAMEGEIGQRKMKIAEMAHQQKMQQTQQTHAMDIVTKAQDIHANAALTGVANQNKLEQSRQLHEGKLAQDADHHAQKLDHAKAMHEANLEAARKQAAIKPKTPKSK